MSVMRGQCDAKPTVTFPAAEHHRPLAGTKMILIGDRGTCVLSTFPWLHSTLNLVLNNFAESCTFVQVVE